MLVPVMLSVAFFFHWLPLFMLLSLLTPVRQLFLHASSLTPGRNELLCLLRTLPQVLPLPLLGQIAVVTTD